MFPTLILFQFVIFSIINSHQSDIKNLENCKKLFDVGYDKLIKPVLRPFVEIIKTFDEKPENYFNIFSTYNDAMKNYQKIVYPQKPLLGLFASNSNGSDNVVENIQNVKKQRQEIIKTYKPFVEALKKPLVTYNCYNCYKNPIETLKRKTIRHGLDIIFKGKRDCDNREDRENHFDLCNKIYIFLKDIGSKHRENKSNLETIIEE